MSFLIVTPFVKQCFLMASLSRGESTSGNWKFFIYPQLTDTLTFDQYLSKPFETGTLG